MIKKNYRIVGIYEEGGNIVVAMKDAEEVEVKTEYAESLPFDMGGIMEKMLHEMRKTLPIRPDENVIKIRITKAEYENEKWKIGDIITVVFGHEG